MVIPALDHAQTLPMHLHHIPKAISTADEYAMAFVDLLVGDLERLGEHAIGQLTGSPEERHDDETDVEHTIEHEDELGGE